MQGDRAGGTLSSALSTSALPLRTVESGAARLDDSANAARRRAAAVAAGTGLPAAIVDRPAMLEIAELTVGLHEITQRRSASRDRLQKHLPDRGCQALGTIAPHRPCQTPR